MAEDTRNPNAVKVLSIAKKFVDEAYAEEGDNLTIMGKWYGLNGQPWCAMFVSYCFDQAGLVNLVAAQSKKGFASCDAGLKWFAKAGQIVPVGQAQPGDIVFFQFDADAEPDHVGLVYSNDGKNLVCFEGNTSADGVKGSQSNGGGAFKKKRPYSLVMSVVRPKWPA
jgi:hypothetical protein